MTPLLTVLVDISFSRAVAYNARGPGTNPMGTFLPKYTQIQLQIILFQLFWDVLWLIKDLLAPLSLFFHEFQQNSQFLRTISNDPDLGRVTYTHEYTQIYIKMLSFKSLIYINYFYIFLCLNITGLAKNNNKIKNRAHHT